jgi:hypothetical protein
VHFSGQDHCDYRRGWLAIMAPCTNNRGLYAIYSWLLPNWNDHNHYDWKALCIGMDQCTVYICTIQSSTNQDRGIENSGYGRISIHACSWKAVLVPLVTSSIKALNLWTHGQWSSGYRKPRRLESIQESHFYDDDFECCHVVRALCAHYDEMVYQCWLGLFTSMNG